MEQFFKKLFLENINRKLFSLVCAIVIWVTISHSITSTRVFTRVPLRIVNLPAEKTVHGLMPNGVLDRKLTLTLTGTKEVIDKLESSDFEVVIDAADKGDEWVVQITKKNLVSLNPDVELLHNVTSVAHTEFVIHLCRLVTEKVPVIVLPPTGEPPEGYQVLDVWPQKLFHIVSGPEEDVKNLQEQGLELSFDISSITKEDLDALRGDEFGDADEVSYFVPESWKRVQIPFLNNVSQTINGQEARHLRIDFLRKEFMSIEERVPVHLFYPPNMLKDINPETLVVGASSLVNIVDGIPYISVPLYVNEVSKLFLDLVRDRIELVLVPVQRNQTLSFRWQVQFVDPKQLEESYVTLTLAGGQDSEINSQVALLLWKQQLVQRERNLRQRFKGYVEQFRLYFEKDKPFLIEATVKDGKVLLHEVTAKP